MCFKAYLDLLGERRAMMGKVSAQREMIEAKQQDFSEVKEMRMEPHQLIQNAMDKWQEQTELSKNLQGPSGSVKIMVDG